MDLILGASVIVLVGLTALVIHLIDVHRAQRIEAFHYHRFHAGDPPEGSGPASADGARGPRGDDATREGRRREP